MWHNTLGVPPCAKSKWGVVTPNPMRNFPPRLGKGSGALICPARADSWADVIGEVMATAASAAAPANRLRRCATVRGGCVVPSARVGISVR